MNKVNQAVKLTAMPVLPLTMRKRPVLNAALANTKIKTIKPVVKLALPGNPPTLLKLDVPDVLQVNIQAMEVVKIVKVVNTKMKPIKAPVKIVLLVNIQDLVEQKVVMLVVMVNIKMKKVNQAAKLIAMPALPLKLIKQPVPNAALANTKINPTKPVVKLAIPGNPPTLLKLDVPDVL